MKRNSEDGDLYTDSGQTLYGSFSAVSKPMFAAKYSLEWWILIEKQMGKREILVYEIRKIDYYQYILGEKTNVGRGLAESRLWSIYILR